MASATYLSNPVVSIAGTDLTDMCSAATLNHLVEALEDTAFGTTSRTYTGGTCKQRNHFDVLRVLRCNRNLRNIVGPRRHQDDRRIVTK
jgi:hypothetical protein